MLQPDLDFIDAVSLKACTELISWGNSHNFTAYSKFLQRGTSLPESSDEESVAEITTQEKVLTALIKEDGEVIYVQEQKSESNGEEEPSEPLIIEPLINETRDKDKSELEDTLKDKIVEIISSDP